MAWLTSKSKFSEHILAHMTFHYLKCEKFEQKNSSSSGFDVSSTSSSVSGSAVDVGCGVSSFYLQFGTIFL